MGMQERIDDLLAQHQTPERILNNENYQLHSDDIHIADLKKRKLAIEDRIASLEAQA